MKKLLLIAACLMMPFSQPALSSEAVAFDSYHNPEQLEAILAGMGEKDDARVIELAETSGGRKLLILEIGTEIGHEKELPAVIAAANMEGTVPLATEAALYLADDLLRNPEKYQDKTWYIIPCGNPDALARYFGKPLYSDPRNAEPVNDDMDEAVDEDGVEDLNGDGIISTIRVRDPEGEWMKVPGEPRLMKKADRLKGETGNYSLYSEGLDNDRDGAYNEDGTGGTNPGINFPHGFNYWTPDAGTWPGSSTEARAVLEFVYEHPEIAMALTFGSSNFCFSPPRTDRKGGNDLDRLRIPERYGIRFGVDTSRTYTFEEARTAIQGVLPEGMVLTDARLAGILGLKAEANPMPEDVSFYKSASSDYREFIKENGLSLERISPEPDKDGSFELLAYYHLGVPSFALDFWTPPTAGKASAEEDEQAGKKAGREQSRDTADAKAFLSYAETLEGDRGFVEWKAFDHPTLGEVEIGGLVPFAGNTPPAPAIEGLLSSQVPWVYELASRIPRISIDDVSAESLGAGVYRIKAIVRNQGEISYPIAMGARNGRILPVILVLENEDIEILEGRKRTQVFRVPANGYAEASWLIKAPSPRDLKIKCLTMNAWSDETAIEIGGAK